tara:strand:- start:230 stop:1111 length:882 start_codon:yes stop_codon:yes gene_type:complete
MKILIQNYVNNISSKPAYLNQCINSIDSCSSFLWDMQNISAYDIIDRSSPDVIIAHYAGITNDLVQYLTSERKIDLIVDVTGMRQHHLNQLEQSFTNANLPIKFLLSETPSNLEKLESKNKKVNILAGTDLFIGKRKVPDFKVKGCVIGRIKTDSFDQVCSRFESHHRILIRDHNNQGNRQDFDMESNVVSLRTLYENYGEVVLNGDLKYIFSQLFFDAITHSNVLSLKCPPEQSEVFKETLGKIFKESDKEPTLEDIKQQIKDNHTCVDRCAELLLALGEQSASEEVLKVKQ